MTEMSKTTSLLILTAVSALLSTPAHAREDEQLWATASATFKLTDKWRLSQEMTSRFSDNRGGLYELEAVAMASLQLNRNLTAAAGYVFNPQYSDGDLTAREHRLREQITIDNVARFGGGKLSARIRLEQRWRENADGTAWRARPYVKYSLPLRKAGKTALVFSNETFINLQNTSFQRAEGIDRMRNLIALSTPLSKRLGLEVGYLNQHGFVRNGEDTVDHSASIALSLTL
jgi:hypothetical protein